MSDKRGDNEAAILLELIKHRHGHRLDPGQLDDLREAVDGVARAAESMRSVRLENSDEPRFIFVPYREEE
jgi:hypothetical protein